MMRALHLFVVTLMLAVLAGCASDVRGAYEEFPPDVVPPITDTPTPSDPTVPGDDSERCFLIPSSHGDLFMGENSAFPVGVYVYEAGSGAPMQDVNVSYRLENTSTTTGELSALRDASDQRGLSEVTLNSKERAGKLVVRASAPCGDAIYIEVSVISVPLGDLLVNFTYGSTNIYAIKNITAEVLLTDSAYCSRLEAGSNPASELRAGSTPTVAGTVPFNGLAVGTPYTIVAWGLGTYNEIAAWGCIDGIVTEEGLVTTATVPLHLLPLDPTGVYDVRARWDFREALKSSGTAGQIITQIANVFENPGRGLYEVIFMVIEAQFGDFVGGAISTVLQLFGLDGVLQNAINSVVGSVPFFQDLQTIGQDLTQVVSNLEVIQKWEVLPNGSQFGYNGYETVNGVALYWRTGCAPTAGPECGRLDLVLDTQELGALAGDWQGVVINYNELRVMVHPIDLNYGRIILYALENLLLPSLVGRTGPVTLQQVMADVIGCGRLGDTISGGNNRCLLSDNFIADLIGCVCDSQATCNSNSKCRDSRCIAIEETCSGFVDSIFGNVLNNLVGSLAMDSLIMASGSMTLVNRNDDRLVEELINGRWTGTMEMNGQSVPVSATFTGTRRANP